MAFGAVTLVLAFPFFPRSLETKWEIERRRSWAVEVGICWSVLDRDSPRERFSCPCK